MQSAPSSPTVLVIDDDDDIREMICLILDGNGCRAIPASNGREALRLLDPSISLVLLDMMMPIMDGKEFRSEQLAAPAVARIPVVIITGDGKAKEKASSLGAVGYLKKPLETQELLDMVARHAH